MLELDFYQVLGFVGTLFRDSLGEIYIDLRQNILTSYPIFIVVNPDYYNPPFITNLYRLLKQSDFAPLLKTIVHILCLFLDIFYGFFRLLVSLLICGFFTCFQALVIFWLIVILVYRWQPLNLSGLLEWSLVS